MRRVAVVTGATAGIGRAVAVRLAAQGFGVLAVRRDRTRGEALVHDLPRPGDCEDAAEHRFLAADLASMAGTAQLTDEVARHTDRVDALVCCAGIFALRPGWTDEGLERTFALNYLSRFLLVRRLEPLLTAAPLARVVLVANAGAYRDRLDLDDPHYRRGRRGMRVATRPSSPTTSLPSSSPSGTGGRQSRRPASSLASSGPTCSATASEFPGFLPPSSRRSPAESA